MSTATANPAVRQASPGIPFFRLVLVEIRKMFNTRSGFWLMASVAILALLATTLVIAFAPDDVITYGSFGAAVGVPLGVLLPVIAIMSVTSEWSQRTGLVTFSQVPHRSTVVAAKMVAAVLVGAVAIPVAMAIGAVGNVVGAAINGVTPVWDMSFTTFILLVLGNILGLLIGFMLGALFRSTPAAIVSYFVYSLVLPGLFELLAALQEWFRDIWPWVDFNRAQTALFGSESLTGEQWAQLGTSGLIWLILPLALALRLILRSEVK